MQVHNQFPYVADTNALLRISAYNAARNFLPTVLHTNE
jgi:hypothetical protein